MITTSTRQSVTRAAVVAALLGVFGMLAVGQANAMTFDPDACLDMSRIRTHTADGNTYRWVPVRGTTPADGCASGWRMVRTH